MAKKVSKEELKSLKQVGGEAVTALLILAGIGLVAGTLIMLSSPYGYGAPGTIITTTTGGPMAQGAVVQGGPMGQGAIVAPGAQTTTTIVQQPAMGYGGPMYGGPMDSILPFAAGVVVGDAISGEGLQQGGALSLPRDGKKGGWIKEGNEYYHYEFIKAKNNEDLVVVRRFVKA